MSFFDMASQANVSERGGECRFKQNSSFCEADPAHLLRPADSAELESIRIGHS